MNQEHLNSICTALNLGASIGLPKSVPGSRGGSFIWHVSTELGSYAIKQLAPAIDLNNEKMVSKYELSEAIASRFAREGIPAISAIEKLGKHLIIIDNKGYLVYPWVEGYVLGRDEISEPHAIKTATIIANIHSMNMQVPEIAEPRVDIHSNEKIIEALQVLESFNFTISKSLTEPQNMILSMNDSYQSVVSFLLQNTVVTHGDLDQLNIIRDKADQPNLIDWESVRKINPTREIVRASLSWSGMGTNDFSKSIYINMLRTYINYGGTLNINHMRAALYAPIGSLVNWIMYNIDLVCTSDDPHIGMIAIEQVNHTLLNMKRLDALIPDLIKVSSAVCSLPGKK